MAQATQPYKRSLSGSIGSGMKSVMGGNDRRFYVLEHKVSSAFHKAGESQRIIVDQIELGRDPKCQVRFDDSFATVSRRHAAIVRDGDNWKLIQLSQTNSTYLNGRKVEKEWYLQSGDEIQLSTNGPKLGFIVPQGDKGLVKSIGLTARMNLFRQQALRPYKTAIAVLFCVFALAICGGAWAIMNQKKMIDAQSQYIAELERQGVARDSVLNNLVADTLRMHNQMEEVRRKIRIISPTPPAPTPSGVVDNAAIDACLPGVYFIVSAKLDISLPDGSSGQLTCGQDGVPGWTGTGFLLDNGKFVTARHVVEPWYFWSDGEGENQAMKELNFYANNGGRVVAHLVAVSSTGRRFQFTSTQFRIDRSHDRSGRTDEGMLLSLASIDDTDYAYVSAGTTEGGLRFDADKSERLPRLEQLTVLGFPLGLGVDASGVNPLYGSAKVAAPNLTNGVIVTTDTNYEHGNSGGPVFYTDSSRKLVVIGVVSAGAGRNIGCIVPISKVR